MVNLPGNSDPESLTINLKINSEITGPAVGEVFFGNRNKAGFWKRKQVSGEAVFPETETAGSGVFDRNDPEIFSQP